MNKEKKPGWVTAVAIIAIVLSGFGTMGGLQEAMSPLTFEQQKAEYEKAIDEFNKAMEQASQSNDPAGQEVMKYLNEFMQAFEKILNMPEWYKTWMVISGLLQIVINGFYLFAAIMLLQLKPSSITLMTIALPFSIILGITRVYVAHTAFDSVGLWMMGGTMIAIVIEIILLLVILKANKRPFRQFEA
ncbi:MAG: hypothetical protein PVG20_08145 [Thioalkalispiraceae bacterium]|jgi:hypothetical protein